MTAIQIVNNVTNIMKLPCVFSCHKMADGELEYLLYDWDEQGQYVRAHKGDWIVEENERIYNTLKNVVKDTLINLQDVRHTKRKWLK